MRWMCSNHFQVKYARFLIKYHLIIFCWIFIMASICLVLLIYKRDEIHIEHLLKGFQAHGTKSSDDYRKLIALIRETQTTHLFPHSIHSKVNISHSKSYAQFEVYQLYSEKKINYQAIFVFQPGNPENIFGKRKTA
ncbi:unnamed protein product [Rotaria magnacalcarata]|uniref:Uncharacterized protein n=1 Tax=Rotaria magnacalcarata TaxID=392030 RepID=A0A8S2KE07_9BILA|nr:unnamed protein product [Rotaria magnacalcarata]